MAEGCREGEIKYGGVEEGQALIRLGGEVWGTGMGEASGK